MSMWIPVDIPSPFSFLGFSLIWGSRDHLSIFSQAAAEASTVLVAVLAQVTVIFVIYRSQLLPQLSTHITARRAAGVDWLLLSFPSYPGFSHFLLLFLDFEIPRKQRCVHIGPGV